MDSRDEGTKRDVLIGSLTSAPAETPAEVFRRCQALEELASLGAEAADALPAILESLVVPVSVDCVLALRVAAAEAAWKVGGRHDLALPILAWALKDEYWGVSRKAAEVLGEMGTVAHEAVPDLVTLAERRLKNGPFYFERFEQATPQQSLLVTVARALGNCGRGVRYRGQACDTLGQLSACPEGGVEVAAARALEGLRAR